MQTEQYMITMPTIHMKMLLSLTEGSSSKHHTHNDLYYRDIHAAFNRTEHYVHRGVGKTF